MHQFGAAGPEGLNLIYTDLGPEEIEYWFEIANIKNHDVGWNKIFYGSFIWISFPESQTSKKDIELFMFFFNFVLFFLYFEKGLFIFGFFIHFRIIFNFEDFFLFFG